MKERTFISLVFGAWLIVIILYLTGQYIFQKNTPGCPVLNRPCQCKPIP